MPLQADEVVGDVTSVSTRASTGSLSRPVSESADSADVVVRTAGPVVKAVGIRAVLPMLRMVLTDQPSEKPAKASDTSRLVFLLRQAAIRARGDCSQLADSESVAAVRMNL